MGLRETVYSRVTGASSGSLVSTRCYPDMLPEDVTFPAIRFFAVSWNDGSYREYQNPTERAKRRVQVDCYASTSDGCAALADAVCDDFDGWTNADVGWCRIANRIDDSWNDDINAYRQIVDVMIDHKR